MGEECKSIKQLAKEAKRRMKSGFWENYLEKLNQDVVAAKEQGISESKIKAYYAERLNNKIRNANDDNEIFYKKVKKLLDEEGEVSNAIGRLTDKRYFNTLSYEEKQRYTLTLSEKYLKAVERYNKEKSLGVKV